MGRLLLLPYEKSIPENIAKEIEDYAQKGLAMDSSQPGCNFMMGKLYYLQNKSPQLALKYLEQACKSPGHTTELAKRKMVSMSDVFESNLVIHCGLHLAEAHGIASKIHLKLNNTHAAIESLKKMLSIEPNNLKSLIDLAFLYSDTGNISEGLSILRRLVVTDKSNPEVNFLLASLLCQNEQYDQSIEYFQRALNLLDPNSSSELLFKVYHNLALAYKYKGDQEHYKEFANKTNEMLALNRALLSKIESGEIEFCLASSKEEEL